MAPSIVCCPKCNHTFEAKLSPEPVKAVAKRSKPKIPTISVADDVESLLNQREQDQEDQKSINIVVVDDDQFTRMMLAELLGQCAYTGESCSVFL